MGNLDNDERSEDQTNPLHTKIKTQYSFFLQGIMNVSLSLFVCGTTVSNSTSILSVRFAVVVLENLKNSYLTFVELHFND